MMKKIILLFLLLLLFSCSDDVKMETLEGKWNLTTVGCFCEPINLDEGEHTWNFNTLTNSITVSNNVQPLPHTILQSGIYPYQISGNSITLESVTYDYKFENEKLYLDSGIEFDGPIITFVRD